MRCIKAIALCFITAAFIWGFYLTNLHHSKEISEREFMRGADAAKQFFETHKKEFCKKPALDTGTIQPKGDIRELTLAESTDSEHK